MSTDYKFEGWMGEDPSSVEGNMVWKEYQPKEWEETDVDIRITHSGICGSDLHVLRSGWGPSPYPVVVGHEIVGVAVKVGSKAEGGIKVGDVVGVGAQSDSCLGRDGPCRACETDEENYCPQRTDTFGAKFRNGDNSYGGYALYNRAPSHFVIKIPDGLKREYAAPMLCGGATLYSPLKYFGAGPGKKVAIVGVGGLGHFGVLFAKALGADEVVGISRKSDKREDCIKLGCDSYIATEEDEDWAKKWKNHFDLVVSTISSAKMPFQDYIGLLNYDGTLVQLGAPEESLSLNAFSLLPQRRRIAGSIIGSPKEIREMLQLAADKQIKPWVQQRPMKEANKVVVDMADGKARYRYVLVNEEK